MKFPILFSLAILLARSPVGASSAVPETAPLAPNEQWVLDRLNSAQDADLEDKDCPDKTRKLGGKFIEALLTGALPRLAITNNIISISSAIIDDRIRLIDAKVPYNIYFDACEFKAGVQLQGITFAGEVSFDECVFGELVEFDRARFLELATFRLVEFRGPLSFYQAQFEGTVIANGIKCSSGAYFKDLKVRDSASFDDGVFNAGASFNSGEVGGFSAERAQFAGGQVTFAGLKSKENMSLQGATFQEPVDLRNIDVGGTVVLDQVQFDKPGEAVVLSGKVGSDLSLRMAVFKGSASFREARVGHDLSALDVRFSDELGTARPAADFTRLDCAGTCRIHVKGVTGELKFLYANLGDLELRPVSGGKLTEVNLFGANVHRSFTLEAGLVDKLLAGQLHVDGPAVFSDIKFSGQANFAYSSFADLHLHSITWPTNPDLFRIEGMNYRAIEAGSERETNDLLLTLAEKARFSAVVYSDLGTYFNRQGYSADADRAFIAGKRRARKQQPLGISRGCEWVLDALIGYGRDPQRAGYVCILVVAFGCVVFSRKKMGCDPREIEKPPELRSEYNRLWYSLGLFLPVVDLKTSELWKPKKKYRFLRTYVRIHILLGWILVPIFLAAISGLIK